VTSVSKPPAVWLVIAAVSLVATLAEAGHELPVYPSFYPHEIAIESVSPERAAGLLRESKIHAYIGGEPRFSGDVPTSIRSVESLGDFLLVELNPASPLANDQALACAALETAARDMAHRDGFVFHPYPVTPLHGDYLFHADLAAAATARFSRTSAEAVAPPISRPWIKADDALATLVRPEWLARGNEWDVAIVAVDAAELVASATTSVNGWLGPPWIKTGWFHASLLLAAAEDAETGRHAAATVRQLEGNARRDRVESINLQRELVTMLTGQCRRLVTGYTLKRQYFSAEFTEGIENIGFDSITGLNSPVFIRTVKLKNFPWNGWLTLGTDQTPDAAWNPIAGFTDPFGQLLWSAVGDPALVRSPYDSGWMLNRVSDVRSSSGQ
jgi:hypothetical protein